MALLHVDRGERQGEIIPLDRDVIVLGRSPECDEVISKLDSVSRFHSRILRINDRYFIEDHLKSRNRVYLNGQLLEFCTQVQLSHQDHIRMCEFEATFLDVDNDSTVEAMLSSKSDHKLETQPAAKLALLLEITAKLSRTLELDHQLPSMVDGLLEIFTQADRCFLILFDVATGRLTPKIAKARIQVDDSKLQFSKTIVHQCLRSGQALLFREGDKIPASSHSVNLFHIRSVMCVPLLTSSAEAFGVIQLDTQDASKKFGEDDLRLLWGVGNQVSLAMENVRLHQLRLTQELAQERAKSELQELRLAQQLAEERARSELQELRLAQQLAEERARSEKERVQNELEIAQKVQLNFLPKRVPDVPGYEFFAYYKAAREVGGDYYDFLLLPEDRLALTVGDVAGKGMPAALLMARLSSEFRSCVLTDRQLTGAISRLNSLLHPFTSPMDRFVTLVAAVLDPMTHTVTLVNAGHPTPLLVNGAAQKFSKAIPPDDDGQSLGHEAGCRYQCYQISLKPGDSLVLFSDGVTDAQNVDGRAFRMKGIHAVLESAADQGARTLGERLVDAVQKHSEGGEQYDDITLLCFGRQAIA